MKPYEELHNELLLMDDDNLAAINNIYCMRMGTPEDYIYNMGDFDEVMQKLGVTAIKKVVAFGCFNPADEYFSFDGEEKLMSYGWRNRIRDRIDDIGILQDIFDSPETYIELIRIV